VRVGAAVLGAVVIVVAIGWAFAAFGLKPYEERETPRLAPVTDTSKPDTTTSSAFELQRAATTSPEPTPAAAPQPAPQPAAPVAPVSTPASNQFVVVIDAGHQAKGNNSPEAIGPGSSETKPSVTSGAEGSVTGKPESEVNLEVSKRIQQKLEAQGVRVVMVRTSQNVDITNKERAAIANKEQADLFLRIHCDDVGDSSVRGLLMLVPAKNKWTGPIVDASAKAGKAIKAAALSATGARDRGTNAVSDMSGFNWSERPAVIVEMGVMSNASEDRALSTAAYQDKLATGISAGVMQYLNSTR
jgi:N-acetylmuramoyl-L-alanine amidase